MEQWLCWSVHWPLERSCPSFLSPPPAVWWRFLWLDPSGSFSSDVSHTCSKTFNNIITMNRQRLPCDESKLEAQEKPQYVQVFGNVQSPTQLFESIRVWEEASVRQTREKLAVLFFLHYQWPGYQHAMITFDTGLEGAPGRSDSPGDLVAELLAGDDGDLLAHPLVGMEVAAQPGVVFLDDDPGGLFHRLGPDSSLWRSANHRVTRYIFYILYLSVLKLIMGAIFILYIYNSLFISACESQAFCKFRYTCRITQLGPGLTLT